MLEGDGVHVMLMTGVNWGEEKSSHLIQPLNPAESRCVWENTTLQSLRAVSNSSIQPRSSATPDTMQTLLIMTSCWLSWAHPPPWTLECLLSLCQDLVQLLVPSASSLAGAMSRALGVSVTWNKNTKSGNPRSERHVGGQLVQFVTQGMVPRRESVDVWNLRKIPLLENTTENELW